MSVYHTLNPALIFSEYPRTRKEAAWGEGRNLVLHSCCWPSGWNKEKDLKIPLANHPAPSIPFPPCLLHLASPLLPTLPLSSSSLYHVSLKGQPPGPVASVPFPGAGRLYKVNHWICWMRIWILALQFKINWVAWFNFLTCLTWILLACKQR